MARRRFQSGQVFLRTKTDAQGRENRERSIWIGRYREDQVSNGQVRRVRRSVILGTLAQLSTRKLALRELAKCLERAGVNAVDYRPLQTATFAEFSDRWEERMLGQMKPSTQASFRGHLHKHLRPFFGPMYLREIRAELVQQFIAAMKVAPKTTKNIIATFRLVWGSARSWGYVDHDPFAGVRLPKQNAVRRQLSFTLEEVTRILSASQEPYRTFFWIAAETGMRAGELCALCVGDLDLGAGYLRVTQSAWHGRLLKPKSESGVRSFALSPQLVGHLAEFFKRWRNDGSGLLFATRNGTPWDANLLVKRKLHPLLDSLEIPRRGLHAFRHANATMMDRLLVPVRVRQQRLGHSDPKITLGVYTHVESEDDARTAMQLGEILDPDGPKNKNAGVSQSANSGFVN